VLELLRDPVWQFIAAAFTMTAIFISLAIYLAQRRHKALTYEVLSQAELAGMTGEIDGRLQMLFEGAPIHSAYLIVLRFVNTGNVAITPADYQRDLTCRFDDDARIISANLTETTPKNLVPILTIQDPALVIKPILLNSGDSMTIQCILTNFQGKIDIDTRIVDVKRVEGRVERTERTMLIIFFGCALMIVCPFADSIIFPRPPLLLTHPESLLFSAGAVVGFGIAMWGLITSRFLRRSFILTLRLLARYLTRANS
jgi:hypothetical protein